jgi:hypothetical protein
VTVKEEERKAKIDTIRQSQQGSLSERAMQVALQKKEKEIQMLEEKAKDLRLSGFLYLNVMSLLTYICIYDKGNVLGNESQKHEESQLDEL